MVIVDNNDNTHNLAICAQTDFKIYSYNIVSLTAVSTSSKVHNKKIVNLVTNLLWDHLISYDIEGTIALWKYSDLTHLDTEAGTHTKRIFGVIIDDANNLLISYSQDAKLIFWNY